jgi:serine/threonine protein kinase
VAIKVILKSSLTDAASKTQFAREVNLLKSLTHPFIAELFEVFENTHYHFLVQEYAPKGNFLEYVNSTGRINEPAARRYFCQLVTVLEYLHNDLKICHRDIKAENLLLDQNMNIRVIDFGLSNQFTTKNQNLQTACGSPAYAPPEMIKGQSYSKSADIWSSGVLLYAMCAGELPFDHPDIQKLLQKVVYTEPKYPNFFSPSLTDLLKKMMEKNPAKRIEVPKIKEHPWFSQAEYSALVADSLHGTLKGNASVDVDVIEQMRKLGLDTKNVLTDISKNEFTPTTAIYRMIYKRKMTDLIGEVMKGLLGGDTSKGFPARKVFPGGKPPGGAAGAPVVSPVPLPGVTLPAKRMSKPIAVKRAPVPGTQQTANET